MDGLDWSRFLIGAVMLCYGSWTDIKTRRVPNYVWLYSGSFAAILLIYDLSGWWSDYGYHIWALLFSTIILFYNAFVDEYILDKNQVVLWKVAQALAIIGAVYFMFKVTTDEMNLNNYKLLDIISISVLMILMYIWFYFGPTIGGADVKAIMTISIVAPFTLSIGDISLTAFDSRGFPFPFVVFMNSLLLYLLIPISLGTYNIFNRNFERPYFQMFLGIKMKISKARTSFVWPMQQIIGKKLVLVAFVKHKSNDEEKWNKLEDFGVTNPWVSLKIPYIVPLALSFFVSVFFGDLFSHYLVEPINSLFG